MPWLRAATRYFCTAIRSPHGSARPSEEDAVRERSGARASSVYRKLAHRRPQRTPSSAGSQVHLTRYALDNHWGNGESLSGAGLMLEATARSACRASGPDHEPRHSHFVFDAPCGDFHWFRHVELPAGVTYIGADVVDQPHAESNTRAYGNEIARFRSLDITSDPLPQADLCIAAMCCSTSIMTSSARSSASRKAISNIC